MHSNNIPIYQKNDFQKMHRAGRLAASILDKLYELINPGISTLEINDFCHDLIIKNNCSKSMMSTHKKYKSSVMASMKVKKKSVSRWGIYNLSKKVSKNNFIIKEVVEKPSIKNAPSNKAVIGRYILPKAIFNQLSNQKPGKGGEIHITDAIQSLINENEKFIAHNFTGKYLDCGTMNGFIKSNIEIGKL